MYPTDAEWSAFMVEIAPFPWLGQLKPAPSKPEHKPEPEPMFTARAVKGFDPFDSDD